MDCLKNLIGLRGTCDNAVYYINDLNGLNNDSLAKAMNAEDESLNKLVDNTIEFVCRYVSHELLTNLRPKVKAKSVLSSGRFGAHNNAVDLAVLQGDLDGVKVNFGNTHYQTLDISSVNIRCNETTVSAVEIWDLDQDTLLKSVAYTPIAGTIINVELNTSVSGYNKSIFIGINNDYYKAKQSGCSSCSGYTWNDGKLSFSSKSVVAGGNKIESDLQTLQWLPFTIDYSLRCNLEPFVCENKQVLAMAILYRTGYELAGRMLRDKKLSDLRLFDGDHKAIREEFLKEFNMQMSAVINHISVPKDPCFECGSRVQMKVSLP